MKLQPCGTNAAYHRHLHNNETPCSRCKAAHAAHARERRRHPKPRTPKFTQAEWDRAWTMLEEGCNYQEVARTTGISGSYLAERLPGYAWTRREVAEWATFLRRNRSAA